MIVVGTTLTTFAMLDPERSFLWDAWLRNAERMISSVGVDVRFFAAIQTDARGEEPFNPLLDRMRELLRSHGVNGEGMPCVDHWFWSLDDKRTTVTQANRGRHITMGQNLISEYATAEGASHLLHMAADTEPPADVLPKLLAVRNGIAAAECSTYCQVLGNREKLLQTSHDGGFAMEKGPMTAVCVLIERELFKAIKWRWDADAGTTDDPTFSFDAKRFFDVDTLTRMDCVALHHPAAINEIENRFPGLDMGVYR